MGKEVYDDLVDDKRISQIKERLKGDTVPVRDVEWLLSEIESLRKQVQELYKTLEDYATG